jgi:hypothetical protein
MYFSFLFCRLPRLFPSYYRLMVISQQLVTLNYECVIINSTDRLLLDARRAAALCGYAPFASARNIAGP